MNFKPHTIFFNFLRIILRSLKVFRYFYKHFINKKINILIKREKNDYENNNNNEKVTWANRVHIHEEKLQELKGGKVKWDQ